MFFVFCPTALIFCAHSFFFFLFKLSQTLSVCRLLHVLTASVTVSPNLTLSDVDPVDASSDFSLFEALRETIYSEVATLISQNESRPHFLIELFHELQLLNTDYLRQRALFSLQVKKKLQKSIQRAQTSTKQALGDRSELSSINGGY